VPLRLLSSSSSSSPTFKAWDSISDVGGTSPSPTCPATTMANQVTPAEGVGAADKEHMEFYFRVLAYCVV
jgi:hypothetical protein